MSGEFLDITEEGRVMGFTSSEPEQTFWYGGSLFKVISRTLDGIFVQRISQTDFSPITSPVFHTYEVAKKEFPASIF